MFFARALPAVLLLLVTNVPDAIQQKLHKIPITCDAGDFTAGEYASVTCHFHKDMKDDRRRIKVVRYPLNATNNELAMPFGTNVSVCEWTENLKSYHCIMEQGYTFNNDITNRLIVGIPSVSDGYRGLYTCCLEPSRETETNACEFEVEEMPETTTSSPATSKPNETGEKEHVVVIVVVVIVAAISWILLGVFVFVFKRRRSNRLLMDGFSDGFTLRQEGAVMWDGRLGEEERMALMRASEDELQQRKAHLDEKIEALVSRFRLSMDDLRGIMKVLSNEMKAGLKKKEEARMKVYPTYLHAMPDGTENGDYLVVNLGSTTLKILLIKLGGGNFKITSNNYKIEDAIRLGTRIQLFQFIADSVTAFLSKHNLTEQRLPLAFVFSFPCKYNERTNLTKARLVKWTKGFDCRDVVGRDVGRLLQDSLERSMTTKRLEMKAVINDGVGILVSLAHKDPDCLIGLVFGNGFNACYTQEETHDVSEGVAENHSHRVINTTEWGSIGENGCLDPFRTDFDTDLDALSVNHKEQTLEKMVSRAYMGEIARLVLVKLIESGLLFTSNEAECHALQKRGAFITDYVSLIENDRDPGHVNTKFVLKQLGMENYTEEDCSIVSYVCGLISERSAHLAAAVLAALINFLNKPNITIAVDGSLYRSHTRFHERLYAKTNELINKGLNFTIKPSVNGDSKGAALIAAASPHQA